MNGAALLREARRRAGMTQAELAQRAGVSQPVVAAYERGRREPTLPMLQKLLAAAGFDADAQLLSHRTLPPVADAERRLIQVLELAAALPHRPRRTLDVPPFVRSR